MNIQISAQPIIKFTKLVDVILDYINIINDNMKKVYDKYTADIKDYIKKLDQIKNELRGG